jgi:hypothetical protein
MSLDAIPAGAPVLIDANILIFAQAARSEYCRRLLDRCAAREISLVVSSMPSGPPNVDPRISFL